MSGNKHPTNADVTVVLQSTITCPECGYRETETMPIGNCQFYYECKGCSDVTPKARCSCSFGTVPCLPNQEARHYFCKHALQDALT